MRIEVPLFQFHKLTRTGEDTILPKFLNMFLLSFPLHQQMVMALRQNCYANYEKENFGSLKTMEKYLVEGSEGAVGTSTK